MRNATIFILALPLLALAIFWIPLGLFFDCVAFPLFMLLATIDCLKGEGFDLSIMVETPLLMFEMYGEITGFYSLDL